MAELVDAPDSKSGALGRSGSTPDIPTKYLYEIRSYKKDQNKKVEIY